MLSDLQSHSASYCRAILQERSELEMVYFLALIYLQRITAPDSNSAFFHERAREVPGDLQSKKCLSDIVFGI